MNRKKFRSIAAAVLAGIMAAGLVACGSTTGSAQGEGTGSEAGSAQSEGTSSTADTAGENAGGEGEVLRIGVECAYAPNNWEEDKASDTNVPISNNEGFYAEGYDIQIAKLVAEHMGRELEVVKIPWDGLLEGLNQGQVDAIFSGMVDSKEHQQAAAFSDIYAIAPTEYGVMVKGDSEYAKATVPSDFAGASLLGQKGTKLDTVIDQIEGVNHVSPVDTIPNMIDRLNAGTVDGIVINLDSAAAYRKTYPDLVIIDFPDDNGFHLDFNGICAGVRKDDTARLDEINAALAVIPVEKRQELMDMVTAKVGE